MKRFAALEVVALLISVFSAAQAHAGWEKLLDCDGGAAVVDVKSEERRNVQLVIRDQNILRYLHQAGVIHLEYGATEYVLRGYQDKGVFNRADFQGFSQPVGHERVISFYPENNGIKFEVTSQHCWSQYAPGFEFCNDNPYSMTCESAPRVNYCEDRQKVADWYFQSCR